MNTRQVKPARRDDGFTLIEIMVVVVIIGLLAAIIAPNIMRNVGRAEIVAAKQEIRTVSGALDSFRLEFYRYPTSDEGLAILTGGEEINDRRVPRFIDSVPVDPWGRPYLYEYPSEHGKDFDLYTLGADGEEGGEDTNADIGNWNLD